MKIFFVVLVLLFSATTFADVSVNFQQENWKEIKLKAEPNQFQYGDKLKIKVKNSSSPVVFKFDEVQEFSKIEFDASIDGDINLKNKDIEFEEDSFLQIGFVVVGDNQLGAMGKMFAPSWVSEIFALAPEGKGLDKIYFYNVASQKSSVNKERQNPKSKYMFDRIIFSKDDMGKLVSFTLPKKLKTAALWIGAKGDTTQSEFSTTVNKVTLK